MGSDQHIGVTQTQKVIMANDFQAFGFQSFHFFIIVHNVPKAIQVTLCFQHVFGHLYGINHSEAESRVCDLFVPLGLTCDYNCVLIIYV